MKSRGARPTTHTDPIYYEEGVLHYCVSNMLAAVEKSEPIRQGVNTFGRHITYQAVAESQKRLFMDLRAVI